MLLPPQPVVPQAPPPPPARRVSRGVIVVIVVLGMLVAALGGVIVAREMSAPTDVALEPVATAGANPFMESVGTDVPDVRPVANTGGNYSGTTPGLYGGSGDNAACDRSQLTRFLGQHPDRAAGWASVLGLRDGSSSTISSYVDGLTSVVLRSDTYVTNHGWSGGEVTSWPAVLQAGTAVLVDEYGNPVTRCFCGNPLTAPQSFNTVAYVGPRWYSFTSNSVTIVTHQTTNVTNNYTIIDVHTGRGHDRPRGTGGERDVTTRTSPRSSRFPRAGGTGATAGTRATVGTARPVGRTARPDRPDRGSSAGHGDRPGSAGLGDRSGREQPHGAGRSRAGSPRVERHGHRRSGDRPGRRGAEPDRVRLVAPPPGRRPRPPRRRHEATPTAPSGTWTATGSCDIGAGSITFGSGSYTAGTTSGTVDIVGDSLKLTPSTGSPATFTESGGSWSDGAGCTLSQG